MGEASDNAVVTVERRGAVAIIWLNRPDVLNAISMAVKKALVTAIEELDRDADVRAIVLAGRGRAFSAGADRKLLAQLENAGRAERAESIEHGTRVTHAMLHAETPIIAAVQGYAVGGGVSLALAADIVLAAEGTVFFIPEVELGLPYLWGSTAMLAASLGMHRARDLVFTCDRFSAEDGERWGLVRAVVPGARLMAEAEDIAARLAALPRHAVAAQKRLNNRLALRYMAWLEDEISLAFDV
ncbi:MAG: enoyl-CoA hydratase/isomerase family protein [Rhodospirillales bacterium]|nr:enoyl-CoA hydratase/isomerase family protein [Alphaproteobacteria bacterium]MDP6843205.1 enoyl-CoA hydratase/isomerase family protein [Rhodospirillales bacterium]